MAGVIGGGVALHQNWIHLPYIVSADATYPVGITDDRVFVGMSHNIFVAKVVKKTGQTNGVDAPRTTQFDVQIIKNVKGSLSGTMNISQEGGYDNGILNLVDHQPMLEVGKTYLLSTRTDGQGLYLVSSYQRGSILISSDTSAGIDALSAIASSHTDVLALTVAYQNEIPFAPDVQSHSDYNSYVSTLRK